MTVVPLEDTEAITIAEPKNPFKRFWRKLFPKKLDEEARKQAYHAYEVAALRAEIARLQETILIQDKGIAGQAEKMHRLEEALAWERSTLVLVCNERDNARAQLAAATKPAPKKKTRKTRKK